MSDEPNGDVGADEADRLDAYRRKRSADRTTEPFGGEAGGAEGAPPADAPEGSRPRLFCVQKHAARRLHYDFRVELGGVLRSWAVPMGPSLNPADKRLAVQVEDHPVEYADFEGVIPEGNYGAGEVIVWDKGLWIPLEDPEETLPRGKLTFELRGYKLRGAWHLFRTSKKKGEDATKEWMLVKRNDGWASDSRALPPESIYSGLTLEEIKTGSERAADVKLMLAETGEKPFTDAEWVFELKYDGYRVLAEREDGKARLRYRRGSDATSIYPDVVQVARAAHDLAEELALPNFVKTSGSTGLHVLILLGGLCTFEQCKQLGELLARVVAGRLPDIATTVRLPGDRGGRVYLDYPQNGHGKLLAAPFTARPVPGALASAPLSWDEVNDTLDLNDYTIRTLPKRMEALEDDPLAPVLTGKPDLVTALGRLAALLED